MGKCWGLRLEEKQSRCESCAVVRLLLWNNKRMVDVNTPIETYLKEVEERVAKHTNIPISTNDYVEIWKIAVEDTPRLLEIIRVQDQALNGFTKHCIAPACVCWACAAQAKVLELVKGG